MASTLLQELKRDNLCTYFVLPLLRLNKFSFTQSNFINSYLTTDYCSIVVQVYDVALLRQVLFLHANYEKTIPTSSYFYLFFDIPKKRRLDVLLFIKGKYSKMSDVSKELIQAWSGLPYKQLNGEGKAITDVRLLALSRHAALRELLEKEYNCEIDDSNELLSKPDEGSFINL